MTRDLFDLPAESVDSTPNPLLARDPALVAKFDVFRLVVADHLLSALIHRDRRPHSPETPNSVEDAKAVAVVLRILTRPEWSRRDLDELAAYWRTAWQSELFGYEFEAVRHRVQEAVAEAQGVFPDCGRDRSHDRVASAFMRRPILPNKSFDNSFGLRYPGGRQQPKGELMAKKHTQAAAQSTPEQAPLDPIAQDLAALSADEVDAVPRGDEGKPVYPPTPDPFGIDKDNLAGVERLRSHRYKQFMIRFAEKPPAEIIAVLKENNYRWQPKDSAWVKSFKPDEAYRASVDSEQLYNSLRMKLREMKGVGREV